MAQTKDSTPTPPDVARKATENTKANLGALVLLGTYGSPGNLTALLRLSNGSTARVTTGDSIGHRRVVAVADGRLALAQNGRAHWIDMP